MVQTLMMIRTTTARAPMMIQIMMGMTIGTMMMTMTAITGGSVGKAVC
jgi:glycerol uptake facilitator-like aquaporin